MPCRIIYFATTYAQRNVPVMLMSRMCRRRSRDSVGRARNPSAADLGVDGELKAAAVALTARLVSRSSTTSTSKHWILALGNSFFNARIFSRDGMRLMSNTARSEGRAPSSRVPRRLLGFGLRGLVSIGQGHLRMHPITGPVHFSMGHRHLQLPGRQKCDGVCRVPSIPKYEPAFS
ncbi:hypothetical protein BGZ61DRAFT_518361 [Ilyonectria robusta]|uniref:uncharacterized protein n=1 Tax=Ilyonectria robusta TaxID=1079257 RepID=UPI001E8E0CAD|nr:uncharacterized protein BGZ61DRAFT_518361 [Ilyonectria robusta]KAH8688227.1 hypothetical protein BGZ61DRAFT_518361 [Ilyonectria robusta]